MGERAGERDSDIEREKENERAGEREEWGEKEIESRRGRADEDESGRGR